MTREDLQKQCFGFVQKTIPKGNWKDQVLSAMEKLDENTQEGLFFLKQAIENTKSAWLLKNQMASNILIEKTATGHVLKIKSMKRAKQL